MAQRLLLLEKEEDFDSKELRQTGSKQIWWGKSRERRFSLRKVCCRPRPKIHLRIYSQEADTLFPEGLERTDNGMKMTSFPEVGMINQKNYYTSVIANFLYTPVISLQTRLFQFFSLSTLWPLNCSQYAEGLSKRIND